MWWGSVAKNYLEAGWCAGKLQCQAWASRPCDTHSTLIRSSDTAPHVPLSMLLCRTTLLSSSPHARLAFPRFPMAVPNLPPPTAAPFSLCSTTTVKRVDQRTRPEGLFVLLWEPPRSHLPGLPSPPVTHQALCPRPSLSSHLHTCPASKRESAMPASPIFLPPLDIYCPLSATITLPAFGFDIQLIILARRCSIWDVQAHIICPKYVQRRCGRWGCLGEVFRKAYGF